MPASPAPTPRAAARPPAPEAGSPACRALPGSPAAAKPAAATATRGLSGEPALPAVAPAAASRRPVGAAVVFPLLGLLLAGAAAPARPSKGETITIPSLGARFKQTDERIAALFQYREGTMPKLDPKQNPFRTGESLASSDPDPGAHGEAPAPPESDEVTLQRGAATLKVNGIVMIGDRALLTINQGTYKVGDVIVVRVRGRTVFLRIREINSHSAVLTLNDAHLELHF